MRNIYSRIKIGDIQQGAIFNGAIADKYLDYNIFGLIITPRCDLEHLKTSVVHYLPVIPFSVWKDVEFESIFLNRLLKELENKCFNIFKHNNLTVNVFKHLSYNKLQDFFVPKIKKSKDKECLKKFLSSLEVINNQLALDKRNPEIINDLLNGNSNLISLLFKPILNYSDKNFYLIESWNEEEKYYIVKLKEVRRLDFNIAIKISKGLELGSVDDDLLFANDINPKFKDKLINYHMILSSPYMEHLIQVFFANFGRIGVQDYNPGIIDEINKEIVEI